MFQSLSDLQDNSTQHLVFFSNEESELQRGWRPKQDAQPMNDPVYFLLDYSEVFRAFQIFFYKDCLKLSHMIILGNDYVSTFGR